jgi:short-subunit dehydrogenase
MSLDLTGAVAVVTGAASGIGRAVSLALADRGAHLALADRNADGLQATAERARTSGVTVSTHVVDVSDAEAVAALPDAVLAEHGRATVLMNNAGVSLVGRFEEVSMEEFRWLMEINLFAVVGLTKAFLPTLLAQERAHIVNVSSLFGLIAPAEQVAYATSKFAVRGFSEALRHELEDTSVGVTVVHPGGVATRIASDARVAAGADADEAARQMESFTARALTMTPEKAAGLIVRAVETQKKRLLIGADARAGDAVQRALPASYWRVARAQFERITGGR